MILHLGRARTRELPGNYPFLVQKTFIDHTIKQWRAPSEVLCQRVYAIISAHNEGFGHQALCAVRSRQTRASGPVRIFARLILSKPLLTPKWLVGVSSSSISKSAFERAGGARQVAHAP